MGSKFNDTFFLNKTSHDGGGLTVGVKGTGTNTANLVSLTVYKNTAAALGGGLYVEYNKGSLDNSIIDGNTISSVGCVGPEDIWGAIIDRGYNLFGTSDSAYSNGKNDIINDNTGLASSLAQNGAPAGYPKTLALSVTSVGYEQGDQNLTNRTAPWNKDERGFLRQNGKVSIGSEDPDAISL
jgi:hypothetical protein